MTTSRLPDWPARLAALAQQRLAQPFAWGSNDCCSWVADAVLAMTGTDTLAGLRGPHRTWQAAYRRHARTPGGVPSVLQQAGLQRIDPRLARRGDVVALVQQPFDVLAICNGMDALAPGAQGLQCLPVARAMAAWRL